MENNSENTWVLVYDAGQVISIVEPGYHTETKFTLKEFGTKEELEKFIQDNNLIINEESD